MPCKIAPTELEHEPRERPCPSPTSTRNHFVTPRPDVRTRSRSAAAAPSCDDCFFRRHMLCALDRSEPCATFRPDRDQGLHPPRQMSFAFRPERATGTPFAFPTAIEQARRYAA